MPNMGQIYKCLQHIVQTTLENTAKLLQRYWDLDRQLTPYVGYKRTSPSISKTGKHIIWKYYVQTIAKEKNMLKIDF